MPHSHIAIIGAPLDLGQDRRGVDMGPSAVRVANLNARIRSLGYEVEDLGNIAVAQAETWSAGDPHAKYFAPDRRGLRGVGLPRGGGDGPRPYAIRAGRGPFGGHRHHRRRCGALSQAGPQDRSDLAGRSCRHEHARDQPERNVHGMPLACIVGKGPAALADLLSFRPKVPPRNAIIVGLRDVDQFEKPHVRESGVRAFTMRDIDERGLRAVMDEAIHLASGGTAGFHLSLDMDFVDPQEAPGVGTPVRGGATYREAHLAMEMICDSGNMLSMEVVEVNPVIDQFNRTAGLAVELAMSGLGKRIL